MITLTLEIQALRKGKTTLRLLSTPLDHSTAAEAKLATFIAAVIQKVAEDVDGQCWSGKSILRDADNPTPTN